MWSDLLTLFGLFLEDDFYLSTFNFISSFTLPSVGWLAAER